MRNNCQEIDYEQIALSTSEQANAGFSHEIIAKCA
jgi:hypothetical protein